MKNKGFTLMELLVVLLIIGILSTVALRTIDATRDRSLFDQTTKEMGQLVQAITGNPDLTYDGRRVDFGFYGDMSRLPQDLRELVHNENNDSNWHGPYVRQMIGGDSVSFMYDGWGHEYGYNKGSGTITSLGNGKYPLTVRVADSLVQLTNNSISGTVSDVDNNPPGDKASTISITLHYAYKDKPPLFKSPDPGGFYSFSVATGETVPIGTHRLVARMPGGDSISRWVTVSPRSQTVLDFRFSRSFRNTLKMVGSVRPLDTTGFLITVVNDGETPDTIDYIYFAQAPAESCYMNTLTVRGSPAPGYPRLPNPAIGLGDTAYTGTQVIGPRMADEVVFGFYDFLKDSLSDTLKSNITGKTFLFRFSDGSEITVRP